MYNGTTMYNMVDSFEISIYIEYHPLLFKFGYFQIIPNPGNTGGHFNSLMKSTRWVFDICCIFIPSTTKGLRYLTPWALRMVGSENGPRMYLLDWFEYTHKFKSWVIQWAQVLSLQGHDFNLSPASQSQVIRFIGIPPNFPKKM